jgi:heme/copper-type cytochrome/quinol oxidase subunit 2
MAIVGVIICGVALKDMSTYDFQMMSTMPPTQTISPQLITDYSNLMAGYSLIIAAFIIGFIIWFILLVSQKHNRKSIHIYGLVGFILVAVLPNVVVFSIMGPKN